MRSVGINWWETKQRGIGMADTGGIYLGTRAAMNISVGIAGSWENPKICCRCLIVENA